MSRSISDKKKRKRHHSHPSRSHSDSDDESSSDDSSLTDDDSSDSEGSSYSSSESSESESSGSESLEEEKKSRSRKKARRSSGSEVRGRKDKERRKSEDSRRSKVKGKHKQRKEKKKKVKTTKQKTSKREKLSMDDYFQKSAEFRVWLSKERGIFFSELSSEESRKLFKKFVNKWNDGLLKKKYYKSLLSSAVGHDAQTKYRWKFASGVSPSDLKSLRDNVSSWSKSKDNFDSSRDEGTSERSAQLKFHSTSASMIGPQVPSARGSVDRGVIGPSRGPSNKGPSGGGRLDPFEREEKRELDRAHVKQDRKSFRKHQELVLDELLPKPKGPGREARMEKKRMQAEKRKSREISPDVADSTLMGPSTDISAKIHLRHEKRQHRAEAAVQKISDYQAKEKARVEAILQMAKANKKEGALW